MTNVTGREHLDSLMEILQEDLVKMVSLAEERIKQSITALNNMDLELAKKIIESDDDIDDLEKVIEQKCIKLIATQQPTAKDLRGITTTLKIISEIERIGDYAVDISKGIKRLPKQLSSNAMDEIRKMAIRVVDFLDSSVDCFIKQDDIMALKLVVIDDEIDASYKKILLDSMRYMRDNGKDAQEIMHLMFITKYLERIADRATNICEWAIFITTGEHKDLNN